jgi:hypothetical protein
MKLVIDDGGRKLAGYEGATGDCVCRAISIATQKPYQEVYEKLFEGSRQLKLLRERGHSPRNGVMRKVYDKYLKSLGWVWTPTMQIGSGCKVHLKSDELPKETIIVRLSKHLATVINGELHDTYDCSRNGTRCVYGYYKQKATSPEIA